MRCSQCTCSVYTAPESNRKTVVIPRLLSTNLLSASRCLQQEQQYRNCHNLHIMCAPQFVVALFSHVCSGSYWYLQTLRLWHEVAYWLLSPIMLTPNTTENKPMRFLATMQMLRFLPVFATLTILAGYSVLAYYSPSTAALPRCGTDAGHLLNLPPSMFI